MVLTARCRRLGIENIAPVRVVRPGFIQVDRRHRRGWRSRSGFAEHLLLPFQRQSVDVGQLLPDELGPLAVLLDDHLQLGVFLVEEPDYVLGLPRLEADHLHHRVQVRHESGDVAQERGRQLRAVDQNNPGPASGADLASLGPSRGTISADDVLAAADEEADPGQQGRGGPGEAEVAVEPSWRDKSFLDLSTHSVAAAKKSPR